MEKSVIIFVSVLCFFSFLGFAYCEDTNNDYFVEGTVYCDTCRTQFMTRVSQVISGAEVQLVCKEEEGGAVTLKNTATTNDKGEYRLPWSGDHEEEICEIKLVKSTMPDCSEIPDDSYLKKAARVGLTTNNGITSPVRLANPLGFLKKDPLPECTEVLKELGLTKEELED
ncbi:Pollen-specific protein-like [Quillaja saponaria]|uniref:Pollen-specific protein-like n=1 Tax=Quillaja saponaria TaxID=32244 RepID=A0AAD7M2Q2_QUISA|nr:Pollen-specific protein-like [Quillaja saponaria]